MKIGSVFYCADNFVAALLREIPSSKAIGRLVMSPEVSPASPLIDCFAMNRWRNVKTVKFESKTQISNILTSTTPLWSLVNPTPDTVPIQTIINSPKLALQKFNVPFDGRYGSWTMLTDKSVVYSSDCSSRFPNGEVEFIENKKAPSRAYLKLYEIFSKIQERPDKKLVHVDMGSSPGGWSYVLNQLGYQLVSIDKTELTFQNPKTLFWKRDIFSIKESELLSAGVTFDSWIFCDAIVTPDRILSLIQRWISTGFKNFIVTIKLKGEINETMRNLLLDFAKIDSSHFLHLHHNKNEITWIRFK
jgi:23S rRNA (cytidine2498-2'-O)-methyltransferase